MRKKDVPQDGNTTLGGARKAMYALDDNGQYTIVPTSGWNVEETVTAMAVERYHQLAQQALQRVRQGQSSPLEYHMFARRMNIDTLAQACGLFQWQVRRHLKPRVFSKLKLKTRQRYAQAMGMAVDALALIPSE